MQTSLVLEVLEGGKATKPSPAAAAQLVLAPTTLQAEYPNFEKASWLTSLRFQTRIIAKKNQLCFIRPLTVLVRILISKLRIFTVISSWFIKRKTKVFCKMCGYAAHLEVNVNSWIDLIIAAECGKRKSHSWRFYQSPFPGHKL